MAEGPSDDNETGDGQGRGEVGIDLSREELVPLADVPRLLPRTAAGKTVHVSVVHRWTMRGIRGVRLEYLQAAGRRCTSREALQRFFERLTAERPRAGSSLPPTAARVRRLGELARAELRRQIGPGRGTR